MRVARGLVLTLVVAACRMEPVALGVAFPCESSEECLAGYSCVERVCRQRGADGGTDGGTPGTDAGVDAGSCGPSSCMGCCQGNVCLAGASVVGPACGRDGESCFDCGPASTCFQGRCRPSTSWRSVSVGYGSTCAVAFSNALHCWGTFNGLSTPGAPLLPVRQVSVGLDQLCVVAVDGGLLCGGTPTANGILGPWDGGSTPQPPQPVLLADGGAPRVRQLELGGAHACAVDGERLYCWGQPHGVERTGFPTVEYAPRELLDAGTGYTQVSTSPSHGCAVIGGEVRCWGHNLYGGLGYVSADAILAPDGGCVEVTSSTTDPHDGIPRRAGDFVEVKVGFRTTCARTALGELWCWGEGRDGQRGDGQASCGATPSRVLLDAGVRSFCVGKLSARLADDRLMTRPDRAAGFACAVAGPRLYCWGIDGETNNLLPVPSVGRSDVPVEVLAEEGERSLGWDEVACGQVNGCAIAGNGALYCWGNSSRIGTVSGERGWVVP